MRGCAIIDAVRTTKDGFTQTSSIRSPPRPWPRSRQPRHATPNGWKASTSASPRTTRGAPAKRSAPRPVTRHPATSSHTLIANTLSNIADRLASAKTTLPWLLLQLGAPAWMLSLLVPIRESGSMLPQILIGEIVRRQAIRKWVWVWGGIGPGPLSGRDRLGRLRARRGDGGRRRHRTPDPLQPGARRLLGRLQGRAGQDHPQDPPRPPVRLDQRHRRTRRHGCRPGARQPCRTARSPPASMSHSWGAAILWLLAAWSFSRIVEFPGATEGGSNALAEAFARLAILRDDGPSGNSSSPARWRWAPDWRHPSMWHWHATISAGPSRCSASSSPWKGSPAWSARRSGDAGRIAPADRSSPRPAGWLPSSRSRSPFGPGSRCRDAAAIWFYPIAFFGLGIAHAGVRLGRKTYLVDMAEGNKRTDYVAVSNTVIGALLLVSGLLGALAATVSVEGTILLLGLAGLAGSALSLRWKEVSG
jgi:hypothetical protein